MKQGGAATIRPTIVVIMAAAHGSFFGFPGFFFSSAFPHSLLYDEGSSESSSTVSEQSWFLGHSSPNFAIALFEEFARLVDVDLHFIGVSVGLVAWRYGILPGRSVF